MCVRDVSGAAVRERSERTKMDDDKALIMTGREMDS
jgi:hypothetical protein